MVEKKELEREKAKIGHRKAESAKETAIGWQQIYQTLTLYLSRTLKIRMNNSREYEWALYKKLKKAGNAPQNTLKENRFAGETPIPSKSEANTWQPLVARSNQTTLKGRYDALASVPKLNS